jgi:hypothetical protein
VIRNSAFWGDQGRIGLIRSGEWAGRLLFVYPDTMQDWWTLVVDPSPSVGVAGDYYTPGTAYVLSLLEEWDVDWMPLDEDESVFERERFGWRPLSGESDWLDAALKAADSGSGEA